MSKKSYDQIIMIWKRKKWGFSILRRFWELRLKIKKLEVIHMTNILQNWDLQVRLPCSSSLKAWIGSYALRNQTRRKLIKFHLGSKFMSSKFKLQCLPIYLKAVLLIFHKNIFLFLIKRVLIYEYKFLQHKKYIL